MTTRARVPGGGGDEFDALREALAVTPSPAFIARVRERIREQPGRAVAAWWPRLALASGVAAAVIIAVVWWNGPTASWRARAGNRVTPRTAVAAPPESAHPPAVSVAPWTKRAADGRTILRRVVAARHTPAAAGAHEHEALVPDDQRRALDRLLIAMRKGRATVPAPSWALEDETGQLVEPPPVQIPLLKPIELLPGTAVDRTGSKDR